MQVLCKTDTNCPSLGRQNEVNKAMIRPRNKRYFMIRTGKSLLGSSLSREACEAPAKRSEGKRSYWQQCQVFIQGTFKT